MCGLLGLSASGLLGSLITATVGAIVLIAGLRPAGPVQYGHLGGRAMTSAGVDLREHTSKIRHLDAVRARELVALFRRPIHATGRVPGCDGRDPVVAATHGWASLGRSPGDTAEDVIGHYATHLYVHEVPRLPLSVARQLVQHRGHLYLDKLTTITDAVAVVLATHGGGGLSLNNLRRLSGAAAWSLGRHDGDLSLNGLHRLSVAAAFGLAHHASALYLSGLKRLSPPAAAALALHRGDLSLEGLPLLSARVATHLARHRGKLHLHGLVQLREATAHALGGRTGHLCLRDLKSLAPAEARLLAAHRGPLYLNAVEISDAAADALGRHEGALSLSPPGGIPERHVAALIRHVGPLCLGELNTIKERTAEILASQRGPRGIAGLSGLFIDSVRQITPQVAAILATHRAGELSLGGLKLLTEDLARELVRHPILSLGGIASVTDRVAGILAAHEGGVLSLRGLQHVSPSGLAKLRQNPGLELPRRLRSLPATPAATAAPPWPSEADTIAAIGRIAEAGEQALSTR